MKVAEHPRYPKLLEAMKVAVVHVRPWSGTIFRAAPPKWAAGRDMISGVGSMLSGGRFNAPGSFPAIYGSTRPELAMIESLAYQRRAGLPIERALPLVFKAISVQVERLLDLTDAQVLSALAIMPELIRMEDWRLAERHGSESLTQAIGRAAHTCGAQALLAASAHTLEQGHNIVLLADNIQAPSAIRIIRRSPKRR